MGRHASPEVGGLIAGMALAAGCLRKAKRAVNMRPLIGPKPRVVIVKNDRFKPGMDVEREVAEKVLDVAMIGLLGLGSAHAAWRRLFFPDDIVAIKVNAIGWMNYYPAPALVEAICRRLIEVGVKPENIYVYDRYTRELAKGGFPINRERKGVRVFGTDGKHGPWTESGKWRGRLSKILLRATAVINVPILRPHGLTGVTIALKNHYGSFNDPGAFHENRCDPYIADLNAHPEIRTKHRLVICDARGRPGGRKPLYSLLVAIDPVAHDAVGLNYLERHSPKVMRKYVPMAKYIKTAERRGLGTCDLSKISLVSKEIT